MCQSGSSPIHELPGSMELTEMRLHEVRNARKTASATHTTQTAAVVVAVMRLTGLSPCTTARAFGGRPHTLWAPAR